ncbi:FG-GAP-like repeat-containing protein [Lacinutrix iliipiscaria]|uniref:FG-GAP-like repeat-containing protein n=1 Tax=Lacinutrix iliipiscaria TaxID=1230532 RepID=A0ABW5WK34_9FLAO
MKKITFLILLVFCALNLNAQDTCNNALAVSVGLHTVNAVDGSEIPLPVCSTNGEGATAGKWYAFTPDEDSYVTVSTDLDQNAGGDTRIQIYDGDCSSLSCVAGDDDSGIVEPEGGGSSYLSIAGFSATAGTTYYIAFDNKWNSGGFDFQITLSEPPPPTPFSFSAQTLGTSGSTMAIVDMNGDFIDDVVSISASNVNLQLQTSSGFTEMNIGTDNADWTPDWSLAAGDYNADGFNDLLYAAWGGVTFMKSNGDMTYTKETFNDYVASQRSNFVDLNNDGHLDAFVCHDVAPSVYYINDGGGDLTFYRSNQEGAPYQLATYYSGGNYGSIWVDYDNDRNTDMFIAKCGGDFPRYVNQMHRNTGGEDNIFVENAASIGLDDDNQTWSSCWGDFDNDGDMDVFVGASSGAHILKENNGEAASYTFTDITASSGVSALTATSREHVTFDFDNDGYLDIVSGSNVLRNNGDMTFTPYMGVFSGTGAFGDLNNDGFIDAYRGSSVYLNDGNDNHWIKISTVGGATEGMSNINGIGARVEVHTPTGIYIRDVRSGDGFEFMNSLNTHVGLGANDTIDNIIVYWPSGIVDNIAGPSTDQHLIIHEGQTLTVEDESLASVVIYPNPVKDIINIDTPVDLTNKIATVFDINGKKVLNKKLTDNSLDVSKLASGSYILRIESLGKSISKKFIKE